MWNGVEIIKKYEKEYTLKVIQWTKTKRIEHSYVHDSTVYIKFYIFY